MRSSAVKNKIDFTSHNDNFMNLSEAITNCLFLYFVDEKELNMKTFDYVDCFFLSIYYEDFESGHKIDFIDFSH